MSNCITLRTKSYAGVKVAEENFKDILRDFILNNDIISKAVHYVGSEFNVTSITTDGLKTLTDVYIPLLSGYLLIYKNAPDGDTYILKVNELDRIHDEKAIIVTALLTRDGLTFITR